MSCDRSDAQIEEPAKVVSSIRASQEPIERLQRGLVLLVLLDERPVGLHRVVELTLARLDLRNLRPQRTLLRLLRTRQARLERFDELAPRAGGLRRGLEARERPLGVLVRGELVRSARVDERGRAVAELLPGDVRELLEHLQLRLVAIGLGEEHLVERREARPLLLLLVQRHERGSRARVGGS